jgi:hypothetical protein
MTLDKPRATQTTSGAPVSTKLALDASALSGVSAGVEVPSSRTAAEVQIVLMERSGTGLPQVTLELQQMNGGSEWIAVSGGAPVASPVGFSHLGPVYGIAGGTVRLSAAPSGTDASTVQSAGLSMAGP